MLLVSALLVSKVESPHVLGANMKHSSFLDLVIETFENIKNLPPNQYRYSATDDKGVGLDTIKIIQISDRLYLGVYHYNMSNLYPDSEIENVVRLANSTDLLNWTYIRTIEKNNASMPYITQAPNGAYIVAFEKEENKSWSHLTFHYYSNLSRLLNKTARADAVYNASRSAFNQKMNIHEGTPNIYNITMKGSMMLVRVGFHYDNGVVDNTAIGSLWIPLDNPSDVNRWVWNQTRPLDYYNQKLRDEFEIEGHMGDREYCQVFGRNFSLQEAQKVKYDDSTWGIFLYNNSHDTFHRLNVTTHKGSTSFANPTFTWLKSPNGNNCLVVTYFLHTYNESAKSGEGGELIFYREFETKEFNVKCQGNNYSVYVTSNSTILEIPYVNEAEKSINFNVSGPEGSKGYCIIKLPSNLTLDLWKGDYKVLLDNKPWPFENWTSMGNTYIYVNYIHSEHKLTIIPEYPLFLLLLLSLIVGTLSGCLHSKRTQQNNKGQVYSIDFQTENSYHKNNNCQPDMFKRRKSSLILQVCNFKDGG
jgi:hypothetical protein